MDIQRIFNGYRFRQEDFIEGISCQHGICHKSGCLSSVACEGILVGNVLFGRMFQLHT